MSTLDPYRSRESDTVTVIEGKNDLPFDRLWKFLGKIHSSSSDG
jgi:hypothetical protein